MSNPFNSNSDSASERILANYYKQLYGQDYNPVAGQGKTSSPEWNSDQKDSGSGWDKKESIWEKEIGWGSNSLTLSSAQRPTAENAKANSQAGSKAGQTASKTQSGNNAKTRSSKSSTKSSSKSQTSKSNSNTHSSNAQSNPQWGDAGNRARRQQKRKEAARSEHNEKEARSTRCEKTFNETADRIGLHSSKSRTPIGDADTHSNEKQFYKPGFFFFWFSVIVPSLFLLIETQTHILAGFAFDPFPTGSHVFLFSLIPASNLLVWLAVRMNVSRLYAIMALGSGMALGIAILYSLMLLPLTGEFLKYAPYLGFGLIGFAPLMSIPFTLFAGGTICTLADRQKTFFDAHQLKHLGHLIILVMVIAVELPSTMTRMHLSMAADAATQQQGIDWLRKWGNRDVLLRACYERGGRATDIIGSLYENQHKPVPVDTARSIYYRVTGVPFNAVSLPASFRSTIQHAGLVDDPAGLQADVGDEFDLDADIAGEMVSGVARGLSVSNSTITGTLNPDAGLASLDWTFTFENASRHAREARAKIVLPPGAVVTRATMWLNDLEKETTIMPRNLARATYQAAVTSHKRDPLLVSMANQDTILVQCYPVMKDELTKIRLHIVAPMQIDQADAALALPTFDERNFAFTVPHKVELTSTRELAMSGADLKAAGGKTGFSLNGNVDNSLLSRFAAITKTKRNSAFNVVNDGHHDVPPMALVAPMHYVKPKILTIVIDQSVTMAGYKNELVQGLRQLPNDIPVTLLAVRDGEHYLCKAAMPSSQAFKDAVAQLEKTECAGGQSNSLALYQAMMGSDIAEIAGKSSVLWIHAAQPVSTFQSDYLSQVLKRIRRVPALFDMQVASGPNEVLKESYDYPALVRVTRTGSLSHDMKRLFDSWIPDDAKEISFTVPSSLATTALTKPEIDLPRESAKDMSQLLAYQDAMNRYHKGDRMGAYRIADASHLVTPVSSAVVTDDVPVPEEKEKAAKAEEDQAKTKMFSSFMDAKRNVDSISEPMKSMKNPIDSAFENVTNQLNSLSSAAGSAGGDGAYYSSDGAPQQATSMMKQEYEAKMVAKPQERSRQFGARDAEEGYDSDDSSADRRYSGAKINAAPAAEPPVVPVSPPSSRVDGPYGGPVGGMSAGAGGGMVGAAGDAFSSQAVEGSQPMREESNFRAKDEVGNNEFLADKSEEMSNKKSLDMGQSSNYGQGANNAPVLQGATNGLVFHSKEMQYGPSGMEQQVIDGVNTAGTIKTEKSAVEQIKAKLLPEPDTTPMVIIVLIVGLTGIFLMTRRAARAEAGGNK